MWSQTLKDSSIDVDENDWGQGDGQELELPVVRVDEGQSGGEAEQHDDEDQADQQPGLGPEPLTTKKRCFWVFISLTLAL